MAKSRGKRVSFMRKIPGTRRRERVNFVASGRKKKRRSKGLGVGSRIMLSECMVVEGRLRCTVSKINR